MKNFLKLSFIALATIPTLLFAAPIQTLSSLTVVSQTSNSVTLNAAGLTVGANYRINVFDATNLVVPKSKWDILSVPTNTYVSTSPNNLPLTPGTYIAKISDETPQIIATSLPFTITAPITNNADVVISYSTGATTVDANASGFDPNEQLTFNLINMDSGLNEGTQNIAADVSGNAQYTFSNLKTGTTGVNYQVSVSSATKATSATFKTSPGTTPTNTAPPLDLSTTNTGLIPNCPPAGCGLTELFQMINKLVNFILFVLAVPIAAIMFAYAGFLMLTGGGSTEAASRARSIFTSVALGLIFAAGAWLIVNTILSILGYHGNWTSL